MVVEFVSVTDIADRLGVKPNVVSNWRNRRLGFPEPLFTVARGQVSIWAWGSVEHWAVTHKKGRC